MRNAIKSTLVTAFAAFSPFETAARHSTWNSEMEQALSAAACSTVTPLAFRAVATEGSMST
jgi:hypothetical protein